MATKKDVVVTIDFGGRKTKTNTKIERKEVKPITNVKNIAEELRKLIRAEIKSGVSYEEIAEGVGRTQGWVSQFAATNRTYYQIKHPRSNTIDALLNYFGLSLDLNPIRATRTVAVKVQKTVRKTKKTATAKKKVGVAVKKVVRTAAAKKRKAA